MPVISTTTGVASTTVVTTTRTLFEEGWFNVKDPTYAATGDGSTDDRPALQAALTAAGANGTVYLPPGTYFLNSTGPLSIPPSGTQDVQTLSITGTPTGGTFTLTFSGKTTGAIAYNATAATVQTALNAVSTVIAAGQVQCTGGALPGTPVTIRFNNLGAQGVITTTDSLTGGSSPASAIAHTTTGTGSASNRLRIQGAGIDQTTIKLSSNAVRAIDLTRSADFDVFQGIDVLDLTVDQNSVASANNQHVVIGDLISGGWSQRINAQKITVRRVRTINVPTASTDGGATGSRQNVSIVSKHLGSSEATQTYVKDIVVEDCDFQGGGVGVAVGGSEPGNTANVFVDNIRIEGTKHDTLVIPTVTAVHANAQLGLSGFGGRCQIIGCDFANAADVGIEIDGMTESVVERTRITDSWNSNFFVRNFNTPQYQNAQRAVFRGCEARVVNLNPVASGATSTGYVLSNATTPTPTVTSISLIDCKFNSRQTNYSISNGQAIEGLDTPYARLVVRNFEAILDNLADTSAGSLNPRVIRIRSSASNSVVFDNVRVKIAGSTTNASLAPQHVYVATGTSLTSTLDLSGLSFDVALTGLTAGSSRLLLLGSGATNGTLRGALRRMVIEAASGDANMKSICITSSASGNAISPSLLIENCDLSKNPGGFDVTDWDATNRAKVKLVGNRFKLSTAYDVASAGTIAVWAGDTANITGTTGITAITAVPASESIRLRFAGTLTVTAGATLKLAGAANFSATADDLLVLESDGTNYRELSRSNNA